MKYHLIDKDNTPIFVIDVREVGFESSYAEITIWRPISWYMKQISEQNLIAEVHWKFDNCTHWNFYGMDYDPEFSEDINPSYYHICGSYSITQWMLMFAFVRTVMTEILGDKTNDYSEEDKKLDKQLLNNYTIKKVES